MRKAIVLAAALLVGGGEAADASCGYFGCGYYQASMEFGAAFGRLSPYDQARFPLFDGSAAVALSNQLYDQWFGINSIPGGFNTVLAMFDNGVATAGFMADPRNFYPPVFGNITANGRACIPGWTVGC